MYAGITNDLRSSDSVGDLDPINGKTCPAMGVRYPVRTGAVIAGAVGQGCTNGGWWKYSIMFS
jgi:hypothetical protein